MSVSENLKDIILKQKNVLAELEKEADIILNSNITIENERLKKEVESLSLDLENANQTIKSSSTEISELKNAMYEQIYNERLNTINNSLRRNDIYFKSKIDGELNKLMQFENKLNSSIDNLKEILETNMVEHTNDIYKRLENLSIQVTQIATISRREIEKTSPENIFKEIQNLKQEPVTDEMIESTRKKNNLEAFLGGNIVNKLGILFLILGIVAISRFTFLRLSNDFKGILMFVISGGMLAVGEFLSRKKSNVFSIGITSAGVASLYISLSISYFVLGIISMYPAILLCILITIGAFVLSKIYNSQTISTFALIGGYIPIVSVSDNGFLVYSAMFYFIILNLLALTFAFYKKWKITMSIGYFLNLMCTTFLISLMIDAHKSEATSILYILFSFGIYTIIPILSNYRSKNPFEKIDVIILSFNTVFSAMIMYFVFYSFDLSRFNGVMTIIFAVVYIFLGEVIRKYFKNEKQILALFYLTGLTFVVLTIPIQFGIQWLSMGWLVQGICLAVYGILKNNKNFEKAGFLILGLCMLAFLQFDLYFYFEYFFYYKYFAMTLGSFIILFAFVYKNSMVSKFSKIYKYAVLSNGWFYILYLIFRLSNYLFRQYEFIYYNESFLKISLYVTVTFFISIILPKISVFADRGVKIISFIMSVVAMLVLIMFTANENILTYGIISDATSPIKTPFMISIVATVLLIALSGLAVICMKNVLTFLVLEKNIDIELLPFILSFYFLILLSQNLIIQYGIQFTSFIISIIYVLAALTWIIYGFIKRFAFMRRFGLGLSILAVAKLFLIDLSVLSQGYKIVSYFAFGITLLGISYVYQYFIQRKV